MILKTGNQLYNKSKTGLMVTLEWTAEACIETVFMGSRLPVTVTLSSKRAFLPDNDLLRMKDVGF